MINENTQQPAPIQSAKLRTAVERILRLGRGTSGRIILERSDEEALRAALAVPAITAQQQASTAGWRDEARKMCEIITALGLDILTVEHDHVMGAIRKLQAQQEQAKPHDTDCPARSGASCTCYVGAQAKINARQEQAKPTDLHAAITTALRIKIDYKPLFEERGWLEVIAEEFTIPGVTGHRFAVHNTVDHCGEYTATHIGTGFAVARAESPDYAIELARKNWLTCDAESLALKMIRAKNQSRVPPPARHLTATHGETPAKGGA